MRDAVDHACAAWASRERQKA